MQELNQATHSWQNFYTVYSSWQKKWKNFFQVLLTRTTNDDDDDDDGRKDGDGDIDNCELNLFFLKMDHLHHRMEF